MNFPLSTSSPTGLLLAGLFGLVFGILLEKGRVTDYNVIVNLFRFRDFTVLKIMLTAILVGGIGVAVMMRGGILEGWHIKEMNTLGVILGGGLFGVGMVLYGYCPGTGVAAIATGSIHALTGFLGMVVGGVFYAVTYGWVKTAVLTVGATGKTRLPESTGIPEFAWWIILATASLLIFRILGKRGKANG
jgi:uncharacterized protein